MKTKILILYFFISFANILAVEAKEAAQTNSSSVLDAIYTKFTDSFVWSAPRSNLSLGIKFLNQAECKAEQPDIFVYLLDVGLTNRNQWWIKPPAFQCVEYYLYDSSHKLVPNLATYHPANKKYITISEVPKNVHNVHIGLIRPSREAPQPYEQTFLTNIFQLEHGGDYMLVAKGRIMKINGDESLTIMEFQPVSLPIHLRDEDVKFWRQNK